MRVALTATLLMSGLASLGAQVGNPGTWVDSVNTPTFVFSVLGNDGGVVRIMLRVGSRVAGVTARGEEVKRFGDSAAVLFARAPQPSGGASYSLEGPRMRLTYGSRSNGAVVHFRVDSEGGLDVEPTRQDASRIVGILRGAAFWAVEQHRAAEARRAGREYPPRSPGAGGDTYFEFQVERPAAPRPGNAPPAYPPMLRSAKVEGEVLAQFVVDTLGRADMSTFHILKSTHDLFSTAVKNAVARDTFTPAELGKRKVKQVVQMPFDFSMTPHS